MSPKKWVRLSLRCLSDQLQAVGYRCSPPTVSRLLDDMKYSLKANVKSLEPNSGHPDRDKQFHYIAQKREEFAEQGQPIISVDTKKKELIGNFKNSGRTWCHEAERVNAHDFPTDAEGRAVPYGIYDTQNNRGSVVVGTSYDTPRFAVDSIVTWWEAEGKKLYPRAERLLILTDAGGSDGCSPRMWKKQLQEQLANRMGLEITVCHYPRGCSKYNPIEHRLFSYISMNWAGKVLRTFGTVLSYIRDTATRTGLKVSAYLNTKVYALEEKVSNKEMKELNIQFHSICPRWNYTIIPQGRGV